MTNPLEPDKPPSDLEVLEAFLLDREGLEQLETLTSGFNVFESIGFVKQELSHSRFLAFLLDPNENHGLGDLFLKRFLQEAVRRREHSGRISAINLSLWDLGEMEILRESENIDIFMHDPNHGFVVILENKVDTTEHSGQLKRYWQAVQKRYPKDEILGIYLTPGGDIPESETQYTALDYGVVCRLVESVIKSRSSHIPSDTRIVMEHYAQMLRRHVVSDEIAEVCRRIYQKHRRALELIYEHASDQQGQIRSYLEELIEASGQCVVDDCSNRHIRFASKAWDGLGLKGSDAGWTSSGRVFLFEFGNSMRLRLKLIVGPGPIKLRQTLFAAALSNKHLFSPGSKSLNAKWNQIYDATFVKAYGDAEIEQIKGQIAKEWAQFLAGDFLKIEEFVRTALSGSQS